MKSIRAAKVVILDEKNQVLVLRRSLTHPRLALQPDLPGGVIEANETVEEGLVREVFEETGLVIPADSLKLLRTFKRGIFHFSINRSVYAARMPDVAPKVTISWEHDEYSWQPLENLTSFELPYQRGIDYATKRKLWSEI